MRGIIAQNITLQIKNKWPKVQPQLRFDNSNTGCRSTNLKKDQV